MLKFRPCLEKLTTPQSSDYAIDHVFGETSTTDELYKSLVEPLVSWAWGGGVATVFAYGQTGSGKSFTVSGLERSVARDLTSGKLEGKRKIHACIIELAGNNAFGKGLLYCLQVRRGVVLRLPNSRSPQFQKTDFGAGGFVRNHAVSRCHGTSRN